MHALGVRGVRLNPVSPVGNGLEPLAGHGALQGPGRDHPQVAALFEARLVWGSDWPHTAFAPEAMPACPGQWEPVLRALSAAQKSDAFERAPSTLYA
jgi:hypothetical protein